MEVVSWWPASEFAFEKEISKAIHGSVHTAQHIPTGRTVAVKKVKAKSIDDCVKLNITENLVCEVIYGYHFTGTPYCLPLYGFHVDTEFAYITSEYAAQGDLFDHLEKLSVKEAYHITAQLLVCVNFIHESGFAHRDISLENILYTSRKTIRLADFAQAVPWKVHNRLKFVSGICGKNYFRAPEVYDKAYDPRKIDVFAVGVVIFMLFAGVPPWKYAHPDRDTRFSFFISSGLQLLIDVWKLSSKFDSGLVNLLASMLSLNPVERPSAKECLMHPWLLGGYEYAMESWKRELIMSSGDVPLFPTHPFNLSYAHTCQGALTQQERSWRNMNMNQNHRHFSLEEDNFPLLPLVYPSSVTSRSILGGLSESFSTSRPGLMSSRSPLPSPLAETGRSGLLSVLNVEFAEKEMGGVGESGQDCTILSSLLPNPEPVRTENEKSYIQTMLKTIERERRQLEILIGARLEIFHRTYNSQKNPYSAASLPTVSLATPMNESHSKKQESFSSNGVIMKLPKYQDDNFSADSSNQSLTYQNKNLYSESESSCSEKEQDARRGRAKVREPEGRARRKDLVPLHSSLKRNNKNAGIKKQVNHMEDRKPADVENSIQTINLSKDSNGRKKNTSTVPSQGLTNTITTVTTSNLEDNKKKQKDPPPYSPSSSQIEDNISDDTADISQPSPLQFENQSYANTSNNNYTTSSHGATSSNYQSSAPNYLANNTGNLNYLANNANAINYVANAANYFANPANPANYAANYVANYVANAANYIANLNASAASPMMSKGAVAYSPPLNTNVNTANSSNFAVNPGANGRVASTIASKFCEGNFTAPNTLAATTAHGTMSLDSLPLADVQFLNQDSVGGKRDHEASLALHYPLPVHANPHIYHPQMQPNFAQMLYPQYPQQQSSLRLSQISPTPLSHASSMNNVSEIPPPPTDSTPPHLGSLPSPAALNGYNHPSFGESTVNMGHSVGIGEEPNGAYSRLDMRRENELGTELQEATQVAKQVHQPRQSSPAHISLSLLRADNFPPILHSSFAHGDMKNLKPITPNDAPPPPPPPSAPNHLNTSNNNTRGSREQERGQRFHNFKEDLRYPRVSERKEEGKGEERRSNERIKIRNEPKKAANHRISTRVHEANSRGSEMNGAGNQIPTMTHSSRPENPVLGRPSINFANMNNKKPVVVGVPQLSPTKKLPQQKNSIDSESTIAMRNSNTTASNAFASPRLTPESVTDPSQRSSKFIPSVSGRNSNYPGASPTLNNSPLFPISPLQAASPYVLPSPPYPHPHSLPPSPHFPLILPHDAQAQHYSRYSQGPALHLNNARHTLGNNAAVRNSMRPTYAGGNGQGLHVNKGGNAGSGQSIPTSTGGSSGRMSQAVSTSYSDFPSLSGVNGAGVGSTNVYDPNNPMYRIPFSPLTINASPYMKNLEELQSDQMSAIDGNDAARPTVDSTNFDHEYYKALQQAALLDGVLHSYPYNMGLMPHPLVNGFIYGLAGGAAGSPGSPLPPGSVMPQGGNWGENPATAMGMLSPRQSPHDSSPTLSPSFSPAGSPQISPYGVPPLNFGAGYRLSMAPMFPNVALSPGQNSMLNSGNSHGGISPLLLHTLLGNNTMPASSPHVSHGQSPHSHHSSSNSHPSSTNNNTIHSSVDLLPIVKEEKNSSDSNSST